MSCQILVSNLCAVPKTEVVALVDDTHVWTANETMKAWITGGGTMETWGRPFSLVIITDRTVEELAWIKDKLIAEVDGILTAVDNKYHFVQPDSESTFFQQLYFSGEVEVTFAELEPFILERM